MTRRGTSKQVDSTFALGRLKKAIAFHEVARLALEYIDHVGDADPVASNAILAAIAYTDALTAAYGGRVNQKDHSSAVKLIRDTLGKALPDAQERRLGKLLARKDEVQYGSRTGRSQEAELILESLGEFGTWARAMLTDRSVSVS